jgi:hypothetical protein
LPASNRHELLVASIISAAAVSGITPILAPRANITPAREVEYMYDVSVRRHYGFPANDALSYGKESARSSTGVKSYGQVMGDVKGEPPRHRSLLWLVWTPKRMGDAIT